MKYSEAPKDVDAEHGIFSAILNSPQLFVEVVDLLKPSDFYGVHEQSIWQAMTDLYKEGKEIDLLSLKTQLKKQEIDPSPSVSILLESWNVVVFGSNLKHFVYSVKNKSLLRQIIRLTEAQGFSATLEDAEADQILQDLEKNMVEIIDDTIQTRSIDSEGIIKEINAEITQSKERGWAGFNSGFPKLDERTGGLIPTQSWIVGAYTGMGKTFFLLQLILNVLREGAKVILFSTEMDRKLNILRLIGNIAELNTLNMLRGTLLEHEEIAMKKAADEIASFKDRLVIYDNVYTLADIRLKSKKMKLSQGLNVVVVDFIQNLRGGANIYERMSEAAVGLQQLGQELNVTVVIGSQVSQASAGWQSKQAIEFKGAGEIAAIADVALWLAKVEGDPSMRQVLIRKVRHGKTGKFDVMLKFPGGRIIDIESHEPDLDTPDDSSVIQQLIK